MYENIITELEFCIRQKETSVKILGPLLGSSAQKEIEVMQAAIGAIKDLNSIQKISVEYPNPIIQVAHEWIDAKERLPIQELKAFKKKYPNEDSIEVIAVIVGATVATALNFDGTDFYSNEGIEYGITHWMPMPELKSKEK